MNDFDEQGRAPIHESSQLGLLKSIRKFVDTNRNQLELETKDSAQVTPLLIAVQNCQLEACKLLIELGARLDAKTAAGIGIVELAVSHTAVSIVEHLVSLGKPELKVFPTLFKILVSLSEEDVLSVAECVDPLLRRREDGTVSLYWEQALAEGLVPAVVATLRNDIKETAKEAALILLLHVIHEPKAQTAVLSLKDSVPTFVAQLGKTSHAGYLRCLGSCLAAINSKSDQADICVKDGVLSALVKSMSATQDKEALADLVLALARAVQGNTAHQSQIGKEHETMAFLVHMFDDCMHKRLLYSLTCAVTAISRGHFENQSILAEEGLCPHLIRLCRVKDKDLQREAISAVRVLAEDNPAVQRTFLDRAAVVPLISHLRKSRGSEHQLVSASAVWALVGEDPVERRALAAMISIPTLLDFVQTSSHDLQLIGVEALCILAKGPVSLREEIAGVTGVPNLVRLLRSESEEVVIGALQALASLCVGVGNANFPKIQKQVIANRGLKFISALLSHAKSEFVQMEAGLTASAVIMGNPDAADELHAIQDFSYLPLLRGLYSAEPNVRLLSGEALAGFCYNCIREQREVSSLGGVPYQLLKSFLESSDDLEACRAAYQIVVLARVIPDEDQSFSSAAGIKKLVHVLVSNSQPHIIVICADYMAKLAHARVGVPEALVALGAVHALSNLCTSSFESVRGTASIALAYLSHQATGRRQLLQSCRRDPFIMRAVHRYSPPGLLPSLFAEGWEHQRRVGLPPIQPGKPQLVARPTLGRTHELTMYSVYDESPTEAPAPHSDPLQEEDEDEDNEDTLSVQSSRGSLYSSRS